MYKIGPNSKCFNDQMNFFYMHTHSFIMPFIVYLCDTRSTVFPSNYFCFSFSTSISQTVIFCRSRSSIWNSTYTHKTQPHNHTHTEIENGKQVFHFFIFMIFISRIIYAVNMFYLLLLLFFFVTGSSCACHCMCVSLSLCVKMSS